MISSWFKLKHIRPIYYMYSQPSCGGGLYSCQKEVMVKKSMMCETIRPAETHTHNTKARGKTETILEALKAGMKCSTDSHFFISLFHSWFPPSTSWRNWQSMTSCASFSCFSLLHRLLSSFLTDPLISGPWNEAEMLESINRLCFSCL